MDIKRTTAGTVALVSSYPLHMGGVETHLLSLLTHCPPGQFRWLLIGPISPEFSAKMRALGAEVIHWQPHHLMDWRAVRDLQTILLEKQVDIVHFHCPRAAFMVRALLKWLQIPNLVTVQLPPYYFKDSKYLRSFFGRKLYYVLERFLNRHCTDRLIYASFQVLEEAQQLGLIDPRRTLYLGNGVDLKRYQGESKRKVLRQEFKIAPEDKLLCSVCRLDEQKGVDILLEAFHLLNPASLKTKLWLVGDGELREKLEAQMQRLGLQEYVTFLGFRNDVHELLPAADIFVLASRYEAMPLAILEAMAAGLPSIVTDTGETAQMVENGVNGLVVPKEDVGMLARAMEIMLTYDEQREAMGEAARSRAPRYSDAETARRVHLIYLQLIKKDRARTNS